MAKILMIDPPGGWRYGFPKRVDEIRGREILDMTLDELYDWLVDEGYPVDLADKNAGWCRFMWEDNDSSDRD